MQIHQSVPLAIAALIGAGGIGFAVREHRQALESSSHEQAMAATIGQLEQRVKELSERNQQVVEIERPAPVRVRRAPAVRRPALVRRPADDPRWQRIENRLSDHEQRIAGAKQDVEDTRAELEGRLSSTKDELGGSIARTHDELVALQKRGERNYSEFTLEKSKYFRKVGLVKDMVGHLRLPSGDLPRAFQVIMEATFESNVPIKIRYVTHRVSKSS